MWRDPPSRGRKEYIASKKEAREISRALVFKRRV